MPNRTALLCALLVCAATALNPTPLERRNREARVIRIEKFRFQPEAVTVLRGATVEWKNIDIVPHTATSLDGKAFDSGRIPAGGSWRINLKQAGTFEYACTLHPNMKGKLLVR